MTRRKLNEVIRLAEQLEKRLFDPGILEAFQEEKDAMHALNNKLNGIMLRVQLAKLKQNGRDP